MRVGQVTGRPVVVILVAKIAGHFVALQMEQLWSHRLYWFPRAALDHFSRKAGRSKVSRRETLFTARLYDVVKASKVLGVPVQCVSDTNKSF